MSIQKSFDILNHINNIGVLSILKRNIEKFENTSSTTTVPATDTKTTTVPATDTKTTTVPATDTKTTTVPSTDTKTTTAPTTDTKTTTAPTTDTKTTTAPTTDTKTTEDKKKESDYKYNTEYLIKWAFVGFGIFAGILILFIIIYYIFFSSNEVIPDNNNELQNKYNSLNYLPSNNELLLDDSINSSRFNSKYNINKQSIAPSSQSSYKTFYNDEQDDKLSKESESSMSTKSLQKSQYYNQSQLSKNPKSSQISQDFEDYQQSQISKEPQQLMSISKEQIAEPESSFFDIFSSKKIENPTTNKIVGGKKKK